MPAIGSIKDPILQTHTEISPKVLKDFPCELVIMARGMFGKACSAVQKTGSLPSLAQGQRFGSELAVQALRMYLALAWLVRLLSMAWNTWWPHICVPWHQLHPGSTWGQGLASQHSHCTLQGNWAERGQHDIPRLCSGSGEEQQVSSCKKVQKSSLKQTPKLKRRWLLKAPHFPEKDWVFSPKTWSSTRGESVHQIAREVNRKFMCKI